MKGISALLIIFFAACNSITSGEKQYAEQFDSIRNVLSQPQPFVDPEPGSIYAQLVERVSGDSGEIRQFYYHINDFYGYISNLRRQFYLASGDSTGVKFAAGQEKNSRLTKSFFENDQNTSRFLYTSLRFTFEKLRHQAMDDNARAAIMRFEDASLGNMSIMEDFYEVYLEDTEPATVITILNSFEQRIRRFEQQILARYFNNYINELKEKILWDGHSDRDTLSR